MAFHAEDTGLVQRSVLSNRSMSDQYFLIGKALGNFERDVGYFSGFTFSALKSFRRDVAFVQTEILESYLEDLLDIEVSPSKLFLAENSIPRRIAQISFFGMGLSLFVGLYAASAGASLSLSFVLMLCVASPFALLWHLSPSESNARRLRLARVLSYEIQRRRGGERTSRRADNPWLSAGKRPIGAQGLIWDA